MQSPFFFPKAVDIYSLNKVCFHAPRHEMAEGQIEFTLSVCVYVSSKIVSGP